MALGVDERSNHTTQRRGIKDSQEWELRPERIPETISLGMISNQKPGACSPVERIKIRLRTLPQRILPGIVLRIDHRPVNATVEVGQHRGIHPRARHADRRHLLPPSLCRRRACGVEIERRDLRLRVVTCPFNADEAETDPGKDVTVFGIVEPNKSASLWNQLAEMPPRYGIMDCR